MHLEGGPAGARSGSSSWLTGAPKRASKASPAYFSTYPLVSPDYAAQAADHRIDDLDEVCSGIQPIGEGCEPGDVREQRRDEPPFLGKPTPASLDEPIGYGLRDEAAKRLGYIGRRVRSCRRSGGRRSSSLRGSRLRRTSTPSSPWAKSTAVLQVGPTMTGESLGRLLRREARPNGRASLSPRRAATGGAYEVARAWVAGFCRPARPGLGRPGTGRPQSSG